MNRLTKVQREAIDATLKAMAQEAPVTPERVVAAAAADDSPLHVCFEWVDSTAAQAYRLDQARALIRSVDVTVLIEERPVEVCYFVRDPAKESHQQGYVTLDQLRKNPKQAREHLKAELGAVLAAVRRAEGYAQVLELTPMLESVRASVRNLAARLEGKPLQ